MKVEGKERKRNLAILLFKILRSGIHRAVYHPCSIRFNSLLPSFRNIFAPSNRGTVNDEIFHRSAANHVQRTEEYYHRYAASGAVLNFPIPY